ncbi:MAG: hypothetical protein HY675_24235 [Chloroflexi bacterium]|nr:hypothetical protein [Chloroflexota bacterium]
MENLVGMDIQGRTTPRLATAWEVGKDGKSITFTLRKGVKFHDGTDFNARAAKWNLEQYLKGEWDGTGNWSSIDVVDDYTVRINLSEYDNGILSLIAITIGMMISPSAVEKNGEEWAQTHPVGTGPFKLVGYERDVFLKYERFDGYWGDKPYLDGIEFRFVKDPMVQSAGLQAGEGHMIYRASANTAADLQKKGYQVIASGYGAMPTHLDVLAPDTVYPDSIFADKRVREALDYAIDKKAIAKAVGLGFWEATQQIAPSQYVGYDPGLEGRSYNPEKAKQLLAAAGRPNGFKTRIIAPNTAEKDMLVAIQSNLKAIGIDVQLEIVPRAKYNEYDLKGWKDGLAWFEVALQPNLTNSLSKFLGAPATRYVSLNRPSAWVDLLNRVRATADFGAYEALTAQAVRFAYDEAMVVPLFALAQPYIIGPKAHDTGFLTTGHQTDWTPQKAWLAK